MMGVDAETSSNCDTKENVDDETSSNCDTCLVKDESVRLGGKKLYLWMLPTMIIHVSHFVLEMIFVTQTEFRTILKDMVSCSHSNKPSEFQKIWSVLSDSLSYVVENMPTCIAYTPSQGYYFKKWKPKQALYDASKCNTPCRDNNDKYNGI